MYLFSEPHPGLMGCPKRLHEDVVRVLANMDGCRMSLAAALCRIDDAVKGTGEKGMKLTSSSDDDRTEGWIMLAQGTITNNLPYHSWRLIGYSEKRDGD